MEKVKIISNPYLRKNTFQIFKQSSGEWTDINAENNPNSKLIVTIHSREMKGRGKNTMLESVF